MNRGLIWAGYAAAGAVVLAIAADFASKATRRSEPVVPVPEGFRQRLTGIGPVEVGFTGRTVFITDRLEEAPAADALQRVLAWRVEGDDPRPVQNGAAVRNARILAPQRADAPPIVVEAPSAWLPYQRAEGDLRLDLDREWLLERPVLTLPGFVPGRTLVATAQGDAWLDARRERVRSPGRFTLRSEDMELVAGDFTYDAATRAVGFAAVDGPVAWSLRDAEGRVFRGTCDGPGTAAPSADGGIELRLQGGPQGLRAALPGGPGGPSARVTGGGLTVHAASAGTGGWTPRSARVEGPLTFVDARIACEGGGADLTWDERGELREVVLDGPASVRPWDDRFAVATARHSVHYDPAAGTLTLDGRGLLVDARGQIAADAATSDGKEIVARGRVVAIGPHGLARADELRGSESGGWTARGEVLVRPLGAPADELRAPSATLDASGTLRMDEGALVSGTRAGRPWTARGARAVSRLVNADERRLEASGGVVYEEPGLTLQADAMEQLEAERFRLDGAPGVATMDLEGGGQAVAHFRRAFHDGVALRVEGAPQLTVPAATLGLAGAEVRLTARTVTRDHASGAWTLDQDVRVAGALEALADRVTWSPANGLRLERRSAAPTASGTLTDGRAFSATARDLAVDAERAVLLEGDAVARLAEADGRVHVLTAERARLGQTDGFAEGRARFDSPLGRGSGQRAEWRSTDGRLTWMKIVGEAALVAQGVSADGAAIEVDDLTGDWFITGDATRAAHIVQEGGRELRADWLRYNARTHLLESGPVRLEQPGGTRPQDPPR